MQITIIMCCSSHSVGYFFRFTLGHWVCRTDYGGSIVSIYEQGWTHNI